MPPANTLVRWVDKNAFAPIVRARPSPTLGRPVHPGIAASITAWYFSASLSDPASRPTPCSPVAFIGFAPGQVPPLGRLRCFQLRARLGFSLPAQPAGEKLLPPLDIALLIRAPEGLEPSRPGHCPAHTTDHSAPVPRIGTVGLAGSPLGPFPLHRGDRFQGSVPEPDPRSRRLKAGCHAGRKQDIAGTDPRALVLPRF